MAKVITFTAVVLLLAAGMAAPSYSQYEYDNQETRIFEGKVTEVDVGGSTLTVKGVDTVVFPISSETKLAKDIYDIKLSDISIGDYVTVEYYRTSSESRVPSKVTKVTVVAYE